MATIATLRLFFGDKPLIQDTLAVDFLGSEEERLADEFLAVGKAIDFALRALAETNHLADLSASLGTKSMHLNVTGSRVLFVNFCSTSSSPLAFKWLATSSCTSPRPTSSWR